MTKAKKQDIINRIGQLRADLAQLTYVIVGEDDCVKDMKTFIDGAYDYLTSALMLANEIGRN